METIIVLGDIHAPFHDRAAVALARAVAKKVKPFAIVSVGDIVDCYSISRFTKRPDRERRLVNELRAARAVADSFRAIAPLLITLGNHDARVADFIASQAPELEGLINLPEQLGFVPNEVTPYREMLKIHKCHFTHDVGFSGAHAAAQSLAAFNGNLVFGHTHRANIVYSGDIRGERHVCMNVGWLGNDSDIDYMHKARMKDWTKGVGLVSMNATALSMQFIPFVKGAAIVNGDIIRG